MSEPSSESELNSPEEDEDIVIESSDNESVPEDDSEVDEKKPVIKEHFTIPFEDKDVEEEEINKYVELYKNKERRMEKTEHDPEFTIKTLQNLIKKYYKKQIDHFNRVIEKCKEKGKNEEIPSQEEKLNMLQKVDKENLMNKLLLYVYKLDENDEKIPEENKPKEDEEQMKIINIFFTETKLISDIERSLLRPSEVPRDKNLQTKYEYIAKIKERRIKGKDEEVNNKKYILDGIGSSSTDDRRKAAKLLKDKMVNKKDYPMRRKRSDYNEDGSLKEKAIKRERERIKELESEESKSDKGYDNRKKRRRNMQNESTSFNRNNNRGNVTKNFKKSDKRQSDQPKTKPEDTGELHPSWAAAKIMKQKQKLKIDLNAPSQAKKIVFE